MIKKITGLFFKVLVSVIELHGMTCVSMSYILAWQDKTNVCEQVSVTIVGEIVAPVLIYGITKTVENIFQKNKTSFSTPIEKVNEVNNNESNDVVNG